MSESSCTVMGEGRTGGRRAAEAFAQGLEMETGTSRVLELVRLVALEIVREGEGLVRRVRDMCERMMH